MFNILALYPILPPSGLYQGYIYKDITLWYSHTQNVNGA